MQTYAITYLPQLGQSTATKRELIEAQSAKQARRLFVDQFGDIYDGVQIMTVIAHDEADPCPHEGVTTADGHGAYCRFCGEPVA